MIRPWLAGFEVTSDTLGHTSHFFGPLKPSEQDAVAYARQVSTKLGYIPSDLFADGDPCLVSKPLEVGSNIVPYYTFTWKDPRGIESYRIEIDASHLTATAIALSPSL